MARKTPSRQTSSPGSSKSNVRAATPAPRPIGVTVTGKPTAQAGSKDAVDEASECSFPASDPPASSAIAAGQIASSEDD